MIRVIKRSIGVRMIVLVASLAVTLLVVGVLGLHGMMQGKAGMETVYNDRVVPLRDLKIIADMYAVNIVDTTHKVRNGNIGWAEARKNLDDANLMIAQKWKAYSATYLVDEEKKLVAEIEPMFKETALALGRLKDILVKEDLAAIAEFSAGPLYPAIDPISEKFSKLIEVQLDVARSEYDKAEALYIVTRNTSIAVIVFGLIAGTGLALWIIRSITQPLTNLQNTIVGVEQRGDLTLRANILTQDEIGRAAAAFDKMMAKIAASAVAAAVEQTSVSITETANNAHTADETATRARAEIEKTLAAVRETADNVDKLAGMIDTASGDIARLAESSRQIDGIAQTIKEIADQTSLLALNAAIEAARAGEQGRGFAVVADEVRKLAENTTKATSEISGLIGGVQSEVDAAVARMKEANDKAGTTRERVVASTGALDAASADTGRVTESVRNIAAAVREQDVAVQQVAKRMEQIAQMTEENTSAAANAADTARQLDGLAGKLREGVLRFRV